MLERLNKKSLIYLTIVILEAFLVIGLVWYFSQIPGIEVSMPEKPEEEKIIEQQLDELGQLRKETPLLTEEEIKAQLKELEKLRQKTNSLSQEKIQKQLEELNKLRQQ